MKNKLQNTRIEFHILQSFPVSCLNRDDVGAPKSAMIGGTLRARVSSQCWKRAIRMAMHDYCGVQTASRTTMLSSLIREKCNAAGATDEQAEYCGNVAAKILNSSDKENKKDALFFISDAEANAITEIFKEKAFDMMAIEESLKEKSKKKGQKNENEEEGAKKEDGLKTRVLEILTKEKERENMDGLDISLFGRMAANAPEVNVEASASVAHAISTHKAVSEVEFFTAVDDYREEHKIPGSGHMGSLEFNSATYYRYISLDLGQLLANLGNDDSLDLSPAIAAFTKALYLAVPPARQTTMTASTLWDYAKVVVRKGQRIQASFETAVTKKDTPSLLEASKKELKGQLERAEKLSGSLYGKIASFEFGENEDFSIDALADALTAEVRKLQLG